MVHPRSVVDNHVYLRYAAVNFRKPIAEDAMLEIVSVREADPNDHELQEEGRYYKRKVDV